MAVRPVAAGIPVVASNRGGLPESVGPGGVILRHDAPAAQWAETIAGLWTDTARYDDLSKAAHRHAARAELVPERQIAVFLDALRQLARC
jgi:glycosyltransferase involved in cell wall biosynthesis